MKILKHYTSHLGIGNNAQGTTTPLTSDPPSSRKMNVLKNYGSYLSIRRKIYRSTRDASPASSESDDSLDISTISPATSILPSPSDDSPKVAHAPPLSTSEYRWNYLSHPLTSKNVWWRNVDSMANFILHWQTRFHQHGDMFGTCTLSRLSSSKKLPFHLTTVQIREAVRRLRHSHPTMALRLAKRSEFGIEQLPIPEFLQKKVDLQVALVYEVVACDADVEAWLDEVLVVHAEARSSEEEEFRTFLQGATRDGVAGRDRLRIHYWPHDERADARILVEQCHSVSEGIGTLIVFDLLLSSVASVLSDPETRSLEWGEEVTRLEPALQDAIACPPQSWEMSREELKNVEKVNADRMNGKACVPNFVDRIGGKVVGMAMDGHKSSNVLRSKVLNQPLVRLCRSVAEKGEMLPLGLLPQTGIPFEGKPTHTGFISDTLDATQTKQLLSVLKSQGLTLAPFLEACSHMATMWTRKHRNLVPHPKQRNRGFDHPNRILGSFSNAISKRDTLQPEHRRYLGLCMSGFPTKIAAGLACWSVASEQHTKPCPAAPIDPLPNVTPGDVETLFRVTTSLAEQYRLGRETSDWLRYDKALMFGTMHTEYLLLRDSAHYPSMPWLSSIGRLENVFSSSHPINPTGSVTLEAHNMRLLGRVGIRQPILHVYTFRMQTTIQFSFADWLYSPTDHNNPRPKGMRQNDTQNTDAARQTILHFWLQVYRSLIDAVLLTATAAQS